MKQKESPRTRIHKYIKELEEQIEIIKVDKSIPKVEKAKTIASLQNQIWKWMKG